MDFQDRGVSTPTIDPRVSEYEGNIRDAYERIDGWESERFTVEASISEMEVEVGPIKYIAALVEDMGVESIAFSESRANGYFNLGFCLRSSSCGNALGC